VKSSSFRIKVGIGVGVLLFDFSWIEYSLVRIAFESLTILSPYWKIPRLGCLFVF
jgi:hypothetical protein